MILHRFIQFPAHPPLPRMRLSLCHQSSYTPKIKSKYCPLQPEKKNEKSQSPCINITPARLQISNVQPRTNLFHEHKPTPNRWQKTPQTHSLIGKLSKYDSDRYNMNKLQKHPTQLSPDKTNLRKSPEFIEHFPAILPASIMLIDSLRLALGQLYTACLNSYGGVRYQP